MSPKAERNHLVARYIVMLGLFVAIVMLALSVVANQHAIHTIQHDRRVRISQINEAALILCQYAHENRELQRQSIRDQPHVVTERFRATGATPAQIERLHSLTVQRMDLLLERYPTVVCPSTFVTGRND